MKIVFGMAVVPNETKRVVPNVEKKDARSACTADRAKTNTWSNCYAQNYTSTARLYGPADFAGGG